MFDFQFLSRKNVVDGLVENETQRTVIHSFAFGMFKSNKFNYIRIEQCEIEFLQFVVDVSRINRLACEPHIGGNLL